MDGDESDTHPFRFREVMRFAKGSTHRRAWQVLLARKGDFSLKMAPLRSLRAIYPAFRVLLPNQVIRADDLARAMVDDALQGTAEHRALVFENRDSQAMVQSLSPPAEQSSGR